MKYWTWKNKTTGEFELTMDGAPMLYRTRKDAEDDHWAPDNATLVRVTVKEVKTK